MKARIYQYRRFFCLLPGTFTAIRATDVIISFQSSIIQIHIRAKQNSVVNLLLLLIKKDFTLDY